MNKFPQQPSEKARNWAQKNTWFGNDKIMTNAAFTIHEDIVGMGVEVESDEYYNEINKRMTESFPHKFCTRTKKTRSDCCFRWKKTRRTQNCETHQITGGYCQKIRGATRRIR
jgi:hypothetical protein